MRLLSPLFALLAVLGLGGEASAAPEPPPVREIRLEPATTSVPLGRARLTVETMLRTGKDTFGAGYRVDVSPLGFMSEEGRLTITVPDAVAHKLADGQPADFTGAADSLAGNHSTVQGTATPARDTKDTGTLRVRIESSKGKLVFKTTYRVVR